MTLLFSSLLAGPSPGVQQTRTLVVADDTLAAAQSLVRPVVLDFASARNPGGGYAAGVAGQEEDLCRQTDLAQFLESAEARPFYEHHQTLGPLNSSWCLYVPVVRVRATSTEVAVIACAAPNAREARTYGYSDAQIAQTMRDRVQQVLRVAARQQHTHLVLGAWGCGHFGNDPEVVADAFAQELEAMPGAFDEVVFAIHGPAWMRASFERRFGEVGMDG